MQTGLQTAPLNKGIQKRPYRIYQALEGVVKESGVALKGPAHWYSSLAMEICLASLVVIVQLGPDVYGSVLLALARIEFVLVGVSQVHACRCE